ncbi:MAG: FeoA domain-containing protein [Candidatus Hydrogenedentes bacterium]|nr:FeoA domain-containing protein [Candidatus Hydrogenedentota bacterium]
MKRDSAAPLTSCRCFEKLEIVSVDGDSDISSRLGEIGCVPGAQIEVLRGGSPMIVRIGDARYCLRGYEAGLVMVGAAASWSILEPAFSAAIK